MKPPHKLPGDWQWFISSKQSHSKPPRKDVSGTWIRPYPHDQSNHKCPMSNPTQPHMLRRKPDYDRPLSLCFACKGKHVWGKRYYYYCPSCNLQFHRGCHVLPLVMKHSLHPSHPLTLISLDPNLHTSKIPLDWSESPSDSEEEDDDDDHHHHLSDDHDNDDVGGGGDDDDQSDEYYAKCKCCLRHLEDAYYHCSICNLNYCLSCTINPLSITHLKSHKHTLTLFPRRISSPCDACGLSLSNTHDYVYACVPALVTTWSINHVFTYLVSLRSLVTRTVSLSLPPCLPVISLAEFAVLRSTLVMGNIHAIRDVVTLSILNAQRGVTCGME